MTLGPVWSEAAVMRGQTALGVAFGGPRCFGGDGLHNAIRRPMQATPESAARLFHHTALVMLRQRQQARRIVLLKSSHLITNILHDTVYAL